MIEEMGMNQSDFRLSVSLSQSMEVGRGRERITHLISPSSLLACLLSLWSLSGCSLFGVAEEHCALA